MKVCIGGTFNILHKGHKLLIDRAFEVSGPDGIVFIGLASDILTKNKVDVKPLEERKNNLEKYLFKKGVLNRTIIKPIDDKFGPSIDGEFDAIVVSPETIKTAEEINFNREKKGKKPLEIVEIPFVLAKDGKIISSSRIINKEIDANGEILNRD